MKIFISADIEGICGVMGDEHWSPKGSDYAKAREWMTLEVNAAVEGALQAGARQVVVKDSHNTATNIEFDKLHPDAELICGWGPLGSMVEGVDESFQGVFLVGYHARVGTIDGTLAHTWSSAILDLQINGQTIGETAWAAAFAGHYGVPVTLVTGDDKLAEQARTELPAGFQQVITKIGWASTAARMRPLAAVREEIRQAAARAVATGSSVKPFKPRLPMTVTVRFRDWEKLNALAAVPNVQRLGADTFQYTASDAIEAQKYFTTLHRLARAEAIFRG